MSGCGYYRHIQYSTVMYHHSNSVTYIHICQMSKDCPRPAPEAGKRNFQSGFHQKQSTETALLRVSNDILMNADEGKSSIIILLDLTAAFDTINHAILLNR